LLVDKIHIDPKNKWCLIIEGSENKKRQKTYCAIPPTDGDRTDIITEHALPSGYKLDCKGLIIVNIKKGKVTLTLTD